MKWLRDLFDEHGITELEKQRDEALDKVNNTIRELRECGASDADIEHCISKTIQRVTAGELRGDQ
jgi:DNA-binding transcriptional regulator YhcF (GntR family)